MITRFSLSIRNRYRPKKSGIYRETVSYQDSQTIGILIDIETFLSYQKQIENIIQELREEDKNVSVLVFRTGKKNEQISYPVFSTKDINCTGKIRKNTEAEKFVSKHLDYLFCFAPDPHPAIINLVGKSKARCRVGSYHPDQESVFELMIRNNQESPKNLIQEIRNYTKKI